MRFLFAVLLLVLLNGTSKAYAQQARGPAEWTILVFMNGDNNLEKFAIRDFAEMAAVGSSDAVNIVVQFDRGAGFDMSNGDWTQTLRFRVERGMRPTPSAALADLGEQNMGEGDVLADFVSWGLATYPSRRTMLVIWDHGDGWRFLNTYQASLSPTEMDRVAAFRNLSLAQGMQAFEGIGGPDRGLDFPAALAPEFELPSIPIDRSIPSPMRASSHDDTSGDKLYNSEAVQALRAALNGRRLDVIGWDACLMAMVETAFAVRDVAQVLVSSEELEPGDGWDYRLILSALSSDTSIDAAQMGALLVNSYQSAYGGTVPEDTTLSAIRLDQISALAQSVSRFGDALVAALPIHSASIVSARAQCYEYAPGYGLHGIDLGCFLDAIDRELPSSALTPSVSTVRASLQASTVAAYAGSERTDKWGSTGLAIYFPRGRTLFNADPEHVAYANNTTAPYPVEFVNQHRWDEFLRAYFRYAL